MWSFAQMFLLAIFHENCWQKSCDAITSLVFKIKNVKKKVARKRSHPEEWKMIGVELLSYSMKEIMTMHSENFFPIKSIGKLWTIWVSWWAEKSRIVHNFPMDLRKNPTICLHYFIQRIKTNVPELLFSIPTWKFSCQSFHIFEFEKPLMWWPHNFCQWLSWKIAKGNAWAKFHIPQCSVWKV